MVKYESPVLDDVFSALANPQRRRMVSMLTEKSYSISELAGPLGLSLPAIYKHIKILERAGLIDHHKVGRSSELVLRERALTEAKSWIEHSHEY